MDQEQRSSVESVDERTGRRGVRWQPAAVVVALAVLALAWVWLVGDRSGQDRVMQTAVVGFFTAVLLLVWLAFLSRLPWKTRLAALAGVIVLVAAVAGTVRIRGVSGDLVPLLAWRWQEEPEIELREELAAVEAASSADEAGEARPPEEAGEAGAAGEPEREASETGASEEAAEASPGAPGEPESVPSSRYESAGVAAARSAARVVAGGAGTSFGDIRHFDYPQFLGPSRNARLPGVLLEPDWEEDPPEELWRRPIGAGFSSFAVVDGLAVTQEQRGPEELVTAYALDTGELVWSHATPVRYESTLAGVGPRATPAIHRDRVFAMGATGRLTSLELGTGQELWSHDVLAEHGGQNPEWGKADSPLVVGERVIVSAGGPDGASLVAYDRETGELEWSGGSDRSGYSSPVLARIAGAHQIVIVNRGSVAAHDPETGRLLWEHPWSAAQPNVANPLAVPGDRVLVSSGYGIGSEMLRIARGEGGEWRVESLWKSPRLKAKFTNPIFHEGYLYGLDDGILVCLDAETGERVWKRGRYGHGQVLLAGDHLLVQAEDGDLVVVEATPEEHRELATLDALDSRTWNYPALPYPYLLARNDREAVAYRLDGQ